MKVSRLRVPRILVLKSYILIYLLLGLALCILQFRMMRYVCRFRMTHPYSHVVISGIRSGWENNNEQFSKIQNNIANDDSTFENRESGFSQPPKITENFIISLNQGLERSWNSTGKPKIILFWTKIFRDYWKDTGFHRFRQCEFSNCFITNDRSMLHVSDAVMFHMSNLAEDTEKDLPPKRWRHQRWILFGRESPTSANFSLYYDEEFNTTVTHKRDADIPFKFGCKIKRSSNEMRQKTKLNHAANKTGLAAWVISHCKTPSKREKYIRELSKYIKLDGYGTCAKRPCLVNETRRTIGKFFKDCTEMIVQNYKFYLAFENTLCEDYVTEKVWHKLQGFIVPVILGGATYSELLPPNSYIDVRNFTSPRKLAEYLKYLDHNDDMYNSYFTWKNDYWNRCEEYECLLCKYLHTNNETKTYKDIGLWWQEGCLSPKEFYKGIADDIL